MTAGDRIIRMKEVLMRTGLHRATIYRKMEEGSFPASIQLGVNSVGWYDSEINEWLAAPTAYRAPPRAA